MTDDTDDTIDDHPWTADERIAGEALPLLGWVVMVGQGAFSTCYGVFHTYDGVCVWLQANGWAPSDCDIRPIRPASRRRNAAAG